MKIYAIGIKSYSSCGNLNKNQKSYALYQQQLEQPEYISFEGNFWRNLLGIKFKNFINSGKRYPKKIYNYDKGNNFLGKTKYKYNELNHVTETADYDLLGNLLYRTEYLYTNTEKGKWLSSAKMVDSEGREIKKMIYYVPKPYKKEPDISRVVLQTEIYEDEKYISKFMQEHEYENSLFAQFTAKYKDITYDKFKIIRTFDEQGRVKSLDLCRLQDLSKIDSKLGTDIVSGLGLIYNEHGKVEKVVLDYLHIQRRSNRNFVRVKNMYISEIKQEVYSPEGRLLKICQRPVQNIS